MAALGGASHDWMGGEGSSCGGAEGSSFGGPEIPSAPNTPRAQPCMHGALPNPLAFLSEPVITDTVLAAQPSLMVHHASLTSLICRSACSWHACAACTGRRPNAYFLTCLSRAAQQDSTCMLDAGYPALDRREWHLPLPSSPISARSLVLSCHSHQYYCPAVPSPSLHAPAYRPSICSRPAAAAAPGVLG